jgi:exosome complex exonuclease DIS3/RRP44
LKKSCKEQNKEEIKIILLTDDAENRRKAREEGIIGFTISDYVKSLVKTPHLVDKLCIKEYTVEGSDRPIFPPHLTIIQIHEGVKNGKLFQGTFLASRENFLEGSVSMENFEKPVRILLLAVAGINNLKILISYQDSYSRARCPQSCH